MARVSANEVLWSGGEYIYVYEYFIYEYMNIEHNIFCSFTTSQEFWQSSAPGALSTLVTSVVLCSLTRATLMSPGKDETRVCGYIYIYIYIYIYYHDFISEMK